MLTEEAQKVRSKGVGASEVAALVGLDPYRTKLDIYMRKLGLVEDAPSFHITRGNRLEPALREWASDEIGIAFAPTAPLIHKAHPHVLATPDGLSPDRAVVLEIKSPGLRTLHEWGDGDEAPERYVVQVVQQMAVTDAGEGYLAALLGDQLRVYRFERDRELEAVLIAAIEKFWRDHIETMTPPEVDGRDGGRAWLARQFPAHVRPDLVKADVATEAMLAELREVREQESAIEARRELLEQRIKATIGDAAGIEASFGRVTWKSCKGRSSVDWEAYARSLGANDDGTKQFTKQGAGYRRFVANFK